VPKVPLYAQIETFESHPQITFAFAMQARQPMALMAATEERRNFISTLFSESSSAARRALREGGVRVAGLVVSLSH
jgi:hypothetical protein